MSYSYIPLGIKIRLWAKAAGRCQYLGCNDALWLDPTTEKELNKAYIAHIVADSPDGPRGDVVRSEQLKSDLSNLMLLCDAHHRLIDTEDVAGHPVDLLCRMKAAHEDRIAIVGAIDVSRKSHIVLYGANVGPHAAPLSYGEAARAIVPERYPAEGRAIGLGMHHSLWTDADAEFWRIEVEQLDRAIATQLRPRLASGEIHHLSLFGFAPQPLLIRFGYALSDIIAAETYQLHREPRGWGWTDAAAALGFDVIPPQDVRGDPAVVFSVSGRIDHERVYEVLPEATIWELRSADPHNDFLQTRAQLGEFRRAARRLWASVTAAHGLRAKVHVFPALPVAAAVEAGRVIQPKCMPPIHLYNLNDAASGFTPAFVLNPENA